MQNLALDAISLDVKQVDIADNYCISDNKIGRALSNGSCHLSSSALELRSLRYRCI